MKKEIVIQTDNGSEFGGVSVDKIEYLNRMMFAPLCAKLIHIPKGKKEFNVKRFGRCFSRNRCCYSITASSKSITSSDYSITAFRN